MSDLVRVVSEMSKLLLHRDARELASCSDPHFSWKWAQLWDKCYRKHESAKILFPVNDSTYHATSER